MPRIAGVDRSKYEVGQVVVMGHGTLPFGTLACDGSAVSRTTYAALFAILSTTWGVGDGSTTFNLPDLRGKTVIGAGTYIDTVSGSVTRTLGQSLGAEKHPLATGELASHSHGVTDPTHQHQLTTNYQAEGTGYNAFGLEDASPATIGPVAALTNAIATGISIQSAGSGTAHNNMQPSAVARYAIVYI